MNKVSQIRFLSLLDKGEEVFRYTLLVGLIYWTNQICYAARDGQQKGLAVAKVTHWAHSGLIMMIMTITMVTMVVPIITSR